MKMSVITGAQFNSAILKLAKEQLPIKVSFKLKSIIKKINEKKEEYESIRIDLLNKRGDKKEDGELDTYENGQVKFSEENLKLFLSEVAELNAIEFELDSISISELGNITLSVEELEALGSLITD